MLRTIQHCHKTEMDAFVKEASAVVEKYGWGDMIVHPYPDCPITVRKILADCRDFEACTTGSQEYLVDLANGLIHILNAWEKHEMEEKVQVRVKESGERIVLRKTLADMYVSRGLAEPEMKETAGSKEEKGEPV